MRRLLILLPVAALLASCGDTRPRFAAPPAEKLECGLEPGRPVGSGPAYTDAEGVSRRAVTDAEAGAYMKALRAWGFGCWSDVAWMRSWVATLNAR